MTEHEEGNKEGRKDVVGFILKLNEKENKNNAYKLGREEFVAEKTEPEQGNKEGGNEVDGFILRKKNINKRNEQELCLPIRKGGVSSREQTEHEKGNNEGRNEVVGFIFKFNKNNGKQEERTRIMLVN